jgi:hypothetical protein
VEKEKELAQKIEPAPLENPSTKQVLKKVYPHYSPLVDCLFKRSTYHSIFLSMKMSGV